MPVDVAINFHASPGHADELLALLIEGRDHVLVEERVGIVRYAHLVDQVEEVTQIGGPVVMLGLGVAAVGDGAVGHRSEYFPQTDAGMH